MKIQVSTKNEFEYVPEFAENRKQELPMKIIFRRQNRLVLQTSAVTAEGKFSASDYVKSLIVRIENPFIITDGQKDRDMKIEDVFKFPELEDLSAELFNASTKLQNEGNLDLKNS